MLFLKKNEGLEEKRFLCQLFHILYAANEVDVVFAVSFNISSLKGILWSDNYDLRYFIKDFYTKLGNCRSFRYAFTYLRQRTV